MADLAMELEHLAEIDRHIAAAQAQIAAVEATSEKLATAGGDCAQTEKLLVTMRDTLATFREQRRLVVETIDDIRAGRR